MIDFHVFVSIGSDSFQFYLKESNTINTKKFKFQGNNSASKKR